MAEIETLGILEEIGALVLDRLQVVSYKWLSRNFLVSSNAAKKLLEEFVGKHDGGLEVVYTVAGWLKKSPQTYHIRLVPGQKLAEARKDFDENCSVQVYSVQACIPKDPATLWNAEFLQAEELFRQPPAVDNCLRDNRFCGVSNSFVKRNTGGTTVGIALEPKPSGASTLSKGSLSNQTNSVHQSSPKPGPLSSGIGPVKTETETDGTRTYNAPSKAALDKEKLSVPPNKKKSQNGKSSAGTGGSVSNFFGRASTKAKSSNASVEEHLVTSKTNDSADAQICAREALEAASSDDEADVNFKRVSNADSGKKRRMVLDESDEEDAVSLASPDPPKRQASPDPKQKNKSVIVENSLNFDECAEERPKVKEEKVVEREFEQPLPNDSLDIKSEKDIKRPSSEETHSSTSENDANKKNKTTTAAPVSPKRRKVVKTRIDERGREVNEVVWEGEETEKDGNAHATNKGGDTVKNAENHAVKTEDSGPKNPVGRATVVKKSPAAGGAPTSHAAGKAANKKGGAKDPKQGNILSFFKRA